MGGKISSHIDYSVIDQITNKSTSKEQLIGVSIPLQIGVSIQHFKIIHVYDLERCEASHAYLYRPNMTDVYSVGCDLELNGVSIEEFYLYIHHDKYILQCRHIRNLSDISHIGIVPMPTIAG